MRKNSYDINQFRIKTGPMGSTDKIGMNGAFAIPMLKFPKTIAQCVVSNGEGERPNWLFRLLGIKSVSSGWEHVSVCVLVAQGKNRPYSSRMPTWEEMCHIKKIFWEPGEVVMQLHPAEKDYVNNHHHVLHLWRPIKKAIPVPPKEFV